MRPPVTVGTAGASRGPRGASRGPLGGRPRRWRRGDTAASRINVSGDNARRPAQRRSAAARCRRKQATPRDTAAGQARPATGPARGNAARHHSHAALRALRALRQRRPSLALLRQQGATRIIRGAATAATHASHALRAKAALTTRSASLSMAGVLRGREGQARPADATRRACACPAPRGAERPAGRQPRPASAAAPGGPAHPRLRGRSDCCWPGWRAAAAWLSVPCRPPGGRAAWPARFMTTSHQAEWLG